MGKSPSFPRVLLGGAIKRLRNAAGLTQTQLGESTGVDQAKIARLENASRGTVEIDFALLNRIFDVLKVGHEEAEELRSFARAPYDQGGVWPESGSQDWWNGQLRAEGLARTYLSFHVETWDGLIQPERYMRLQFQLGRRAKIEAATKTRLARQAHAFEDSARPGDFVFVMTQAALYRNMGDPLALAAQLEHALVLTERDNVTILIVRSDAPIPTQVADFTIMRFRSRVMSDLALVQHPIGAIVMDDDNSVADFQARWDQIYAGLDPSGTRARADLQHDSRQLMQQRLTEIRAQ